MVTEPKTNCGVCGVEIRPATAEKTGGLCRPCAGGYRENIEQAKLDASKERERDRSDPFRKLWKSLVDKVFLSPGGYESLSEAEKLYFAVNEVIGEVYNGGFEQYFFNSSGDHYSDAEKALVAMNSTGELELLRKAKNILFSEGTVPVSTGIRRQAIHDRVNANRESINRELDQLDEKFWSGGDALVVRLERFAAENGLVDPL